MAAVHPTRPSSILPRALLTALFISPLLTGCFGSDSGSSGNETSIGKINALGVSGLTYQTASQSGKTNAQGEFQYYPGETLSLWVGDLRIAEGVSAQEWITPLEFFPDTRALLQTPSVDSQGLSTHTITEQQLVDRVSVTNLTRFLIALNWTESVREGKGIEIRDRVITQLNAALPKLTGPIDFSVSQAKFEAAGTAPSPANQLLAEICFYPKGNELCEKPPTEADIDSAPERPENEDDWDPDIEYKQDLKTKKQRIIDAARTMEEVEVETAKDYLTRELTVISTIVGNRFYLDNHTAKHSVNDTSNKLVKIQRIDGSAEIADMDALSTRPQDVVLHSFSAQMAEAEYYIDGPIDGESEILISFLPENTYRWVRKTLRVIITN